MNPNDVLNEIREMPKGGILSDEAMQFCQTYFDELGLRPMNDWEKLMHDHWLDSLTRVIL